MSTVTDLSVVDVLDRADQALATHGWGQHSFVTDDGRMCLDGALRYAIAGTPEVTLAHLLLTDEYSVLLAARLRLAQVIAPDDDGFVTVGWNDEPGRTVDEVRAALRAAREIGGDPS